MPDLLSHVLIGLIIAELFNMKKSLLVLGSILPDILSKIYLLTFFFHINSDLLFVTIFFHSLVMGLIIPGLITPFFKYDWKKTYLSVMLGFMAHLFADSFSRHYHNGIILYPFAEPTKFFSFNLLWVEQYWIILVMSIIMYASIKLFKYYHAQNTKKKVENNK